MLAVIVSVLASWALVRSTACCACSISRSARSRYSVTIVVTAVASRASRSSTNMTTHASTAKNPAAISAASCPAFIGLLLFTRDCDPGPTLSRMPPPQLASPAIGPPGSRSSGGREPGSPAPGRTGATRLTAEYARRRPARALLPGLVSCRSGCLAVLRDDGAGQDGPDAVRPLGHACLGAMRGRQVVPLAHQAIGRVLLPQDAGRVIVRVLIALPVAEPGRAGVARVAQVGRHGTGQAVPHVGGGRVDRRRDRVRFR